MSQFQKKKIIVKRCSRSSANCLTISFSFGYVCQSQSAVTKCNINVYDYNDAILLEGRRIMSSRMQKQQLL